MKQFIEEVIDTTWDNLTEDTIAAAKKVLLDTVGAMIAGANESSTTQLIEQVASNHEGKYTVVGSKRQLSRDMAAFINGVSSVAIEMDEGNQWSKGHPAAHVVPALLTVVEEDGTYNGKQFLLHLVKAYEFSSRFGRATTLVPDAHAHGTWGIMGAAATVLLNGNYNSNDFYKGLNISASFAMPTMWNAALEGALVRNVYVGHATEQALRTRDLLEANYLAPAGNIEYVFSKVVGSKFDRENFKIDKEKWDIERNYFKDHAYCRYAHAPLDAYEQLISEHNLSHEQIEAVYVRTYRRAATLSNQHYHNVLSAKFSIPYAIAAWSYKKRSDHGMFHDQYLQDKQIQAFAQKVFVETSEELEKDYPSIMPAEVEIKLKSGKTYIKRLDLADSGLGSSVSFNHLVNKFNSLTTHLSDQKRTEIVQWIERFDELESISSFMELLRDE